MHFVLLKVKKMQLVRTCIHKPNYKTSGLPTDR